MQDLPPNIASSSTTSRKLAEILESILEKIEQGESVDIEALKAQHPDIAPQLEQCIQNLQFIEGAAEQLEISAQVVTDEQDPQQKPLFREIGDFRIIRQLGRGGMGIVYEAEQLSLSRKVALKVLPFAMLSDQRSMQRFKNEVAAVASLDHPNIVDVYAVACDKGVHHFAMRLICGNSVSQILEQIRGEDEDSKWTRAVSSLLGSSLNQGMVSTQKAKAATTKAQSTKYFDAVARFGESIAQALDYAHEHGVIHRDVKPANLMIDDEGKAWITDFGLAQMATGTQLTMTGDLLGTALYMSPEQLMAKRIGVDHRTDIYSLGVTLYEMLTLAPPFKSENRQELFRQIMMDEPKPLRKLNAFLPDDLETIVLKAIEKNPMDRYASAKDLADDLQRFRQRESIRARRATFLQKTMKWTIRHQALTWSVMLTLIGMSIVSMVAGAMIATKNGQLTTANKELSQQTSLAKLREAEALAAEADSRSAQNIVDQEKKETERQRDIATGNLYLAHMRQAQQDWNNGQINRLHELLEGYIPEPGQRDLRRWEWYYFLSLCYQELHTLSGHIRGTFCVSWSPDGKLVASGNADRTIKIWDVAEGKELRTLTGHVQGVQTIDWSPDGKRLVSGSSNGNVKIWATDTGEELTTLKEFGPWIKQIAWSPDERFICWGEYGDPGNFVLWDAQAGRERSRTKLGEKNDGGGVEAIAWSPDSRLLALGAGSLLMIWDVETEKEVHSWKAHEYDLWALAWSPNGDRLASGAYDSSVKLWNTDTWQVLLKLPHQSGVSSVDWSPDGSKIAVGTWGQEVKIWDSERGIELTTFRGHSGAVYAVAWCPDGQRIASGSEDRTTKIWDATSIENGSTKTSKPSELVEWSPDRKYTIRLDRSSANRKITVHNATSTDQVVLETDIADNEVISWDPTGKRIAIPFENTVGVWDVTTGQRLLSLNGHTENVWGVRWSPDGKKLASSAYDGTLKIWDGVNGDKQKTLLGLSSFQYVSGVTWSPDGEHIAAGGWDRTVRVWNTASGNELFVLRGHTGGVWDLDWSPDGSRLASREQDGQTIKLWDALTGQEILTLTSRGEGNLRWSADGRQLHSGTTTFDAVRGFEQSGCPMVASAAAWRHFDRSWELALSGRFNEGRDSYQKALKYNPLLANSEGDLKDYESTARFRYGGLLASNGELEAAADAFRSALAFNPKDFAAHFNLGNILTESGKFSLAIESFGRAIELEPMMSSAYNGMGMALAGNGEFEASFVALSKAIEQHPARAKFRNDLAWLLATCPDLRFRNPARAIEVAEKAVELNPNVAIVWNTLGVSHYRNGNYQAAADALQKSLELSQEGTGFTTRFDGFFLAMAYWRLADHQRARNFYIKAEKWMRQHKPEDRELQRFRDEANELLGKNAITDLSDSSPGVAEKVKQ